ncbi:hypothetical protein QMK33_08240 [Hymenobacter sp. H14-R3]|uniref:hypothetical protein n=1 Tax=Hymenobacter sp. H14-R3 TaxID=3046308 RepID=UPI0024BA130E|nr:hypothetical protein [Hymenobacter sp. H14-R3]MDJ0365140.1 hypothetical protein [Hymenobacter sp. H14-R3]
MLSRPKIHNRLPSICLWATLTLAGVPEQSQAQTPLKARYKDALGSSTCSENNVGGGCVTNTNRIVELRKNKAFLYTESVNNCSLGGSTEWTRSVSQGKKDIYSYQLRHDTLYLKDPGNRFFVFMGDDIIYSDKMGLFTKEKKASQ